MRTSIAVFLGSMACGTATTSPPVTQPTNPPPPIAIELLTEGAAHPSQVVVQPDAQDAPRRLNLLLAGMRIAVGEHLVGAWLNETTGEDLPLSWQSPCWQTEQRDENHVELDLNWCYPHDVLGSIVVTRDPSGPIVVEFAPLVANDRVLTGQAALSYAGLGIWDVTADVVSAIGPQGSPVATSFVGPVTFDDLFGAMAVDGTLETEQGHAVIATSAQVGAYPGGLRSCASDGDLTLDVFANVGQLLVDLDDITTGGDRSPLGTVAVPVNVAVAASGTAHLPFYSERDVDVALSDRTDPLEVPVTAHTLTEAVQAACAEEVLAPAQCTPVLVALEQTTADVTLSVDPRSVGEEVERQLAALLQDPWCVDR